MSIPAAISSKICKHQKMEHLQPVWLGLYHPGNVSRSSMACTVCHVLQEHFLRDRFMKVLVSSLLISTSCKIILSIYLTWPWPCRLASSSVLGLLSSAYLPFTVIFQLFHMSTFKNQWEKNQPKTEFYISDPMCAFFSSECEQAILMYMPSLIDLFVFSKSTFFLGKQ